MMKTLNSILGEVYGDRPVKGGELKFVKKHERSDPKLAADRNGNKGDMPFKAKGVKPIERSKNRHGYDTGQDKGVYEDHDPHSRQEYLKHHSNAVSALEQILSHLQDHKKYLEKHSDKDDCMVRHPSYDMKAMARQLEDIGDTVRDNLRTSDNTQTDTVPQTLNATKPMKPKKYISGTKYG